MRLRDLDPKFIRYDPYGVALERNRHVPTMAEAEGIRFLCPCGTGHMVAVWFAGRAPAEALPTLRWAVSGSSFDDISLTPSIDLSHTSPCAWHGWVRNGDAS